MNNNQPAVGGVRTVLRRASAGILRQVRFPGRYRLGTLLAQALGDEPLPFTIPLRAGGRLTIDAEFWRHMFFLGEYEWDIESFLVKNSNPGDTVVDVGASIGICTVPVALHLRSTGKVLALEALPANFTLLTKNCEQNGLTNVVRVFGAVSDAPGTIEAPICESGNYSLASAGKGTQTIPARTLDAIAEEQGVSRIHLMKIDIEGSETRAFRGAAGLFRHHAIRMVVSEFNGYWLTKMGSSPEELYDQWESYGLEIYDLTWAGKLVRTTRSASLAAIQPPNPQFKNVVLIDPKFVG